MQYREIDNFEKWTLADVLNSQAQSCPEEVAIEFVDGPKWRYQDCFNEGRNTAAIVNAINITQQNKVAVMVDDPTYFCRFWFGLSMLGAVMVAINTGLKGGVLVHQFENSQPSLVVTDSEHLEVVVSALQKLKSKTKILCIDSESTNDYIDYAYQEFTLSQDTVAKLPQPEIKPSDLSCVMYTSGTSGPSKGVLMPEAHCFTFALGTIDNQKLNSDHTFYICLPLFHANGLFMQLYPALVAGAKAVIRQKFSATKWLSDVQHYGATHSNFLGATAAFVAAQPSSHEDKSHSLELVTAAPLTIDAFNTFTERFGIPNVLPLYGMTEVNIPLYGQIGEPAPGTCGKVYERFYDVEIRDPETDLPLPDDTIGEIMVRHKKPFCFMSGYLAMPEKTLEAWRNFWFHTGDAGMRREDGYFVFLDRIKDSIRRRGENISSYEVEQALLEIEGVTEVAAYAVSAGAEGMEDEVMVSVMVSEGHMLTPKNIRSEAQDRLAKFAVPRYIRLVSDLPKTATGKIRKAALRDIGVTEDTWDAEY